MKLKHIAVIIAAGIMTITSCDAQKNKENNTSSMEMKTEVDSVSYALGVNIGSQIKSQFKDIDIDILAQAIRDAYADNLKITAEAAGPMLQEYVQKAQLKIAESNLKEGQDYLAENAKKKGVTTTASGLQYEVINEGSGPNATAESKVKVHYHGSLIDGRVFDSSVERGEPATFGVTQVIKGWTEALQLMNVGAKYKLYIPADLAYGSNPRPGGIIEPNHALIFEVELLEIQ